MSPEAEPLRILFFPFMCSGHVIPTVDMARVFAAHGVKSTIITTPANGPLLQPTIDRANKSGHHPYPITLALLPFPSAAVGLPDGCEDISKASSPELKGNFLKAVAMLRKPFAQVLVDLAPDCVVTDMFLPWTVDVAAEHGVPRLVFHGTCFFSLCAKQAVERYKAYEEVSRAESLVLPGLPHRIEMFKSQLPDNQNTLSGFVELFKQMKGSEQKSYGVVVNSFYDMEPKYADHYRMGRRAWHIGPLSLCNKDEVDKSGRGNKPSIDSETCLKWLDSKNPRSVLYVCFGSMSEFSKAQLREMALGFEASNHSFIWVVRNGTHEWLPEGYEERIKGRSLLIRGWAPQILILNHPAVGGFITHCGWNSGSEGVSAGVPMITWPLFAEQFYNAKLIVEVLGIGVSIGVKKYTQNPEERPVVGSAEIERAVGRLMGGGEEAEGRRRRARELGEMAKRAVEKGGSSYIDVENLINELLERRAIIRSATLLP